MMTYTSTRVFDSGDRQYLAEGVGSPFFVLYQKLINMMRLCSDIKYSVLAYQVYRLHY